MEDIEDIDESPFYIYDDQNEEGIIIVDNEDYDDIEQNDDKLQIEGNKDSTNELIDNKTVEAVKNRLINDPQYRKELLERVLP